MTETPTAEEYNDRWGSRQVRDLADAFSAGKIPKSAMLNVYVEMPSGHREIIRKRLHETAEGIYAKWERLNDLGYLFQEWDKATRDA